MPTQSEIHAATDLVVTIAQAVRSQYEQVLGILKRAGLVEERAHVLRWVGPAGEVR